MKSTQSPRRGKTETPSFGEVAPGMSTIRVFLIPTREGEVVGDDVGKEVGGGVSESSVGLDVAAVFL